MFRSHAASSGEKNDEGFPLKYHEAAQTCHRRSNSLTNSIEHELLKFRNI